VITRLLKINLSDPLTKSGLSKSALAKQIRVAPDTLNKMLSGQWDYVAREAIERAADYLRLEVTEIFEFVPVHFWKSIEETNQCTFLRGSRWEEGREEEVTIPGPDSDATNEITAFVRSFVSEVTFADHQRDVDELITRVMDENCIVVGSPKSNTATEILLSRFFGAEPFNPEPDNRFKIPFGFCWPETTAIEKESSLTCSDKARKRTGALPGIAVKGGIHVPADYMDYSHFIDWAPNKLGLDCGLVFVANRPFGTDKDVKLIVLAGFSGMGTLAAAKAVLEDFRYLEPVGNDECVYGVVQCLFSKDSGNEKRIYKRFRWQVRKGGSSPILGTSKKRRSKN
jgi:DNA-binding Xre family transcriptional regulator